MSTLYIYDENNKDHIGELQFIKNQYKLTYYNSNKFNVLFPKLPNSFNSQIFSYDVENYLSNIIPEGQSLKVLLNKYKLTEYDLFKIVSVIKNDFSGCFSFHQEKTIYHQNLTKKSLKDNVISIEQLYNKIKEERLKSGSFIVWNQEPRLSVAGFQPKLNVFLNKRLNHDFSIHLPNNIRSNYLIKIDSNDEKDLVLNEFFHLKLAKKLNLHVADCFYQKIKGENVLFIKRFDREIDNDSYFIKQKFHQIIDGCILLNVPVNEKYQHFDNKTSFKTIFEKSIKLIKEFDFLPEETFSFKEKILQQVFYNLLINNFDHHAKNISFFYNPIAKLNMDKFNLTPLYDVVNVDLYPLNKQFSLFFGNAKQKQEINIEDFVLISKWLDIDLTFTNQVFQKIINDFKKIDFNDFYQKELLQPNFFNHYFINNDDKHNQEQFLLYFNEIQKNVLFYESKLSLLNELNQNSLIENINLSLQNKGFKI